MLHVCIHQSVHVYGLHTNHGSFRLHLPWSFKRQIQEHTLPGFLHCSGMWLIFFICSEFYIENMPCCISNIIAVLTEHNEHSTNARYSHQIEVEVDGGTGSKTVLGRLGLGVIAVFSFHAQLL